MTFQTEMNQKQKKNTQKAIYLKIYMRSQDSWSTKQKKK